MKQKLLALAALASMYATASLAAIPTAVTDAIDDGVADGTTLAYALLTFAVTIGVIMFIKRKV